MATLIKFGIPKFDGEISCYIWKVQMKVVLTQNRLKKAVGGKTKMPESMTNEPWEDLDQKALSTIQLCFTASCLARSPSQNYHG